MLQSARHVSQEATGIISNGKALKRAARMIKNSSGVESTYELDEALSAKYRLPIGQYIVTHEIDSNGFHRVDIRVKKLNDTSVNKAVLSRQIINNFRFPAEDQSRDNITVTCNIETANTKDDIND